MTVPPLSRVAATDPSELCRRVYLRIHQRTWRTGMDERKVSESRDKYSVAFGSELHVKVEASKPTGVALGHPLPDKNVSRRLWRLSKLIEHRFGMLGERPALALVPASFYHVTVYS